MSVFVTCACYGMYEGIRDQAEELALYLNYLGPGYRTQVLAWHRVPFCIEPFSKAIRKFKFLLGKHAVFHDGLHRLKI